MDLTDKNSASATADPDPAPAERRGLPWSLVDRMRGKQLKTKLLNPHDTFFERRLGISTLGWTPMVGDVKSDNYRVIYEPTPYRRVLAIFKQMRLSSSDVLVDLGSGMGRVVFSASWYGAKQAIGIEVDESLHRAACANRARRPARYSNVDLRCMYAEEFSFAGVSALYMYHPFGPQTMRTVIRNIEESLRERPRRFVIAYMNPVVASVIEQSAMFRTTAMWPASLTPRQPYPRPTDYAVRFWESV